ncbi:MAG: hypothetical protein NC033_01775 [Clostridiales bacterium]|nr:hypothetical protein [Clostridiales bacterium]
MSLFSKKKTEQRLNDRELIAENSKSVNALLVLAEGKFGLCNELKILQEKLKYLIPSENADVIEYDELIKAKLCTLQAFLERNSGNVLETENFGKVEIVKRINEIKVAISNRNTIL